MLRIIIKYFTDIVTDMHEDASPYVSMMAVAMSKKYSLVTWNTDVVNYILDTGAELYLAIKVEWAAFYTIEVPQITVGHHNFCMLAEHLFDSLLEPTIMEAALEKILFKKYEYGVVATKIYSCAVFSHNGVYYMYDGYGNNLVGLGEGPENRGVACMFRFKTLKALVERFVYNKKRREVIEPTEATRFIISTVKVGIAFQEAPELIPRRERILEPDDDKMYEEGGEGETKEKLKPINVLGYTRKGKYITIQGTQGLDDRMVVTGTVKNCHFISICTLLGLLCKPIKEWSTKRVDYVFESGVNLYPFIDNVNFADKRSIRNLQIDKYFFDIVIKRIPILNPEYLRTFATALDVILSKHYRYVLVQFPNCCYVLYKSKKYFHLFDSYGLKPQDDDKKKGKNNKNKKKKKEKTKEEIQIEKDAVGKACWIKFNGIKQLNAYLKENTQNRDESFFFFSVNVAKYKKAAKWRRLEYKLRADRKKKKRKIKPLKILHESEEWLEVYPVPWSRMTKHLSCGVIRDTPSHKWHSWDVEYPNDLFSLVGNIHQTSKGFSRLGRGKQTIANCIVAIIMTEMYCFENWNSHVLNCVLRYGNTYFKECVENIDTENYELRIEDFKKTLVVPPYNVRIDYHPKLEGTMYIIKPTQYNLSKALRDFFETKENRHGIIACAREGSKTKFLAFGRIQLGEYYMYDCQTIGPPMFLDKYRSCSYILRCTSLNRLLHVMTMTLRGGDFFIHHLEIIPSGEEREEAVVNYEDERTVTSAGTAATAATGATAPTDTAAEEVE